MLVYGDSTRFEPARDVADAVARELLTVGAMAPGIHRHATLVSAFIRAGELVQGIADAEFELRGFDARSQMQERGSVLLLQMATAIDRSWRSAFTADLDVRPLMRLVKQLAMASGIRTKTGEGFAHYALYPESYLAAARSSGLGPKTCVIGIRSIGTALGALVAAALGARPAISVRPVGHPFEREIHAAADLLDGAEMGGDFAVVDEGPGLSGSSFASVAKWLTGQGVETRRIHFFPSHDGEPGSAARAEVRFIWRQCPRHPAASNLVLSGDGGLGQWLEQAIGPFDGLLQPCPVAASVAQDTRFARPKFLARKRSGSWLVKFAGLGEIGEQKFRDAQTLASAGFGPQTPALCYGFLVQDWIDGEPLTGCRYDRPAFLERLAAYLAFRATWPAAAGPGASPVELRQMAVENSAETLGSSARRKMEQRLASLEAMNVRPLRTDNRLHAWEWLVAKGGFLKVDAVDHCRGHDLIGCQDIAWDVAGAIAEHDLDADETASFCRLLERQGIVLDRELVAMMLPCYLAFQVGLWTTAQGAQPANMRVAEGYARKLRQALSEPARDVMAARV